AHPQRCQLVAAGASKWTDSAAVGVGSNSPVKRFLGPCDLENTVVQSRVIVNGFLIAAPLACQLAPGCSALATWGPEDRLKMAVSMVRNVSAGRLRLCR